MLKIQFESTVEEAVEAQFRLIKQSANLRKMKYAGLVFAPVMFVMFYWLPLPDRLNIWGAVIAPILFIVFSLKNYDKNLRKRLRKLIVEKQGHDLPTSAEYELNDQGISFQKLGNTIAFAWHTVEQINVSESDIEFRIKHGGIAVIPCRIFNSEEEKNQWLDFAREKIVEAKPIHPPTTR